MAALIVLTQGLTQPVALRPDAAAGTIVVAQRTGDLIAVDAASGLRTPLATLPGQVSTFDLSPSGQTAYVAGSPLGLWQVPLDGNPPTRIMRTLIPPGAVLVDAAEQTVLMAEGENPGRLLAVTLQPSQAAIVAGGLASARGLAQEQATARLFVAEAANGGRLVELQADGSTVELVGGLGEPVDLAWQDSNETHLVVADAAGGRVVSIELAQPGNPPVELASGLVKLWAARPLGPDRLAIGAGDSVLVADLPPLVLDPVELPVPAGELFIAGWVTVPVIINDPALTLDDVDFLVEPREAGALVSLSRDNSFDPANPAILLSAGWKTGEHHLVAINRADGSELGRTRFHVLDTWTDPQLGPSIATFGSIESGPDSGTWGGPDSGDFTVPQNVAVHPALGTRNVGVVLVETSTANAQFPTGAALNTLIADLQDEMVNGVTIGGQLRSVATYFAEASNGLFNLNLVGIAGPIALPNGWNSYFTMNTDGQWVANADLDSTVISEIVAQNTAAAQAGNPPVLDLTQMDSIIYVVCSRVDPPNPDLSVWPRASLTTETQIIGTLDLGFITIPIPRAIARVLMPHDWATRDVREFHETVAHELCHNLGLVDQYSQTAYTTDAKGRITARAPTGAAAGSWEMLAWEQNLALPSAAHRLMLGWLPPGQVKLYNFGVFGAIDENITLHAAAAGPAPAGRFAAAEVRLEDGRNYYFEYRPAVAGRIVDSAPPDASAVLGTDALTRLPEPTDRAQILLVGEDADAVVDRGSFLTGEDYREQDTTSPGFEQDFIVDVTSTTADAATIRVRYAADSKPDPAITPWSPSSNWQSPDLEVINGRSLAEPAFRNIPWEGHDNTIQARFRNLGLSNASGVTVNFFAKDFTFGGGVEASLGAHTQDIPAGAVVTFTAPNPWRPVQLSIPIFEFEYQQHSCLVARVAPFLDPVSNIWEVTPENNEAQSNYTWMVSTTSSPATREVTTILAENPFDVPAIVSFAIRQPHPFFRVYLNHRWVRLEPGEQQRILVMVESLLGDDRFAQITEGFPDGERRIETTLRLSALGDTGKACAPSIIGGVSLLAMTGLRTHFEFFQTDGGVGHGRIVQTDTGVGVDGPVVVSVLPRDPADSQPELVREAEAINGEFRVELGRANEGGRIQAHYLGRFSWMPCDSDVIEL